MNLKQKVQVEKLKNEGYSFKEISEKLNVSVGTVKSYFARKDLHPEDKKDVCPCCGKVLVQLPGRKTKKFCSDKCRMKWWRDNSDVSKTTISKVCPICNLTFISYPSKKQTYCSKQCSGKARWLNAAQHNDVSDNV